MKKILLWIASAFFLAFIVFAQQEPGQTRILHSSILQESRKIQVIVPTKVYSIKQVYPVLYVFDGESLFWPTIAASRFLNRGSSIPLVPEAIVVSIANTHRDRDMPVPQQIKNNNGASNFLRFLSTELVPYINKHYPVNGLNVLIGHSQGGLFVTYAGIQVPELFPFILALDAPVTINELVWKEYESAMKASCLLNYFSGESVFGWGDQFPPKADCKNYQQKKIEGETHETMPYKGIYEGLKFLFREHIPPQKDIPLTEMQAYYKALSQKYNCNYSIPAALLLSVANEKINVSKKEEALDLLAYYVKTYGASQRSAKLLTETKAITGGPDKRIDFYLSDPGPPEEILKSFMGKWKGTVFVPGGMNMDVSWEIIKVNDRFIIESRIMDQFNSRSDFLLVTTTNELAWGRKHEGGGIYLSIGKLSDDGKTITGTEDLIGFKMPEGIPPFKPNTFEFRKIKE